MKSVMSLMSGGQILMLLLSMLVSAIFLVVVAFYPGDTALQIISAMIFAVMLWLGSRVAMPAEAHRMRTARYAVWVFGGVLILVAGAHSYLSTLIALAVFYVSPSAASVVTSSPVVAPAAIVALAAVIMFVSFLSFLRDKPPLGAIARDPITREASYRDKRAAFAAVLKSRIEQLDEELRWHHKYFVSLRAEVDVRNANHSGRRVSDLVEAIKINQDADVFVVVGVPGAGKSVALRKCCIELLHTQKSNERIPVYVNLKEWSTRRRWSAEEPPTDEEFADFVRLNIRNSLPDHTRTFFDQHFKRMADAGDVFFMFDSFDEIPGILDADETSKLLDAVSGIIVRYLRGQAAGRGVIASRYYRRPRLGQERYVQLDVRPFSDQQIARAIEQSASRSSDLKQLLFRDRPDLGALARNPFSFSLILFYWESRIEPPANQSDIYSAYIDHSLEGAHETLAALEFNATKLRAAMADIAWAMFESDKHGLEMTVGELRVLLGRDDMDAVVDALVSAKLVRKAPRTQAVSFVHRRFNEYFLVARWLTGERKPPFEAIPTDSRYRDALVLYAEVADETEARRLAQFCWDEIIKSSDSSSEETRTGMRAVYALRFLTEAFRALPAPIAPFRSSLGQYVRKEISANDDILTRKIAVEAIGLLQQNDAEYVLLKALRSDNRWIIETALSACRYLPSIPQTVADALVLNLSIRKQSWILWPDREFNFSLGIADAFIDVKRRFTCLRAEAWLGILVGVVTVAILEMNFFGAGFLTVLSCLFYMLLNACMVFMTKAAFRDNNKFLQANIVDLNGHLAKLTVQISMQLLTVLETLKLLKFDNSDGEKNRTLSVRVAFLNDPFVRGAFYQHGLKESAISVIRSFPIYFAVIVFVFLDGDLDKIRGMSFGYEGPFYNLIDFKIYISSFAVAWLFLTLWRVTLLVNKYYIPLNVLVLIFWSFVITGIVVVIPVVFLIFAIKYSIFARYLVIFIIAFAVSVTVSRIVYQAVTSLFHDRRRLREATNRFNPSRILISEVFSSFATSKARLRYVQWLEREATGAANQAKLCNLSVNPWPNGRRPNKGDDEASILLSRLDARWIGLEA